jgi:hypothetical protein
MSNASSFIAVLRKIISSQKDEVKNLTYYITRNSVTYKSHNVIRTVKSKKITAGWTCILDELSKK